VKDSELLLAVFPPKGIRIERRSKNTKLNEAKRRKQDKFQEELKFWKIKAE